MMHPPPAQMSIKTQVADAPFQALFMILSIVGSKLDVFDLFGSVFFILFKCISRVCAFANGVNLVYF